MVSLNFCRHIVIIDASGMKHNNAIILLVLLVASRDVVVTNNITEEKILEILAKITDEFKQNATLSFAKQKIWDFFKERIADEVKKQNENNNVWTSYQKANVSATGILGLLALILTIIQTYRARMEFRKRRKYQNFDLKFKTKREVIREVVVLMTKLGGSTIFDDVLRNLKEEVYMNNLLNDLNLFFRGDLCADNRKSDYDRGKIKELTDYINTTNELFRILSQGLFGKCFMDDTNQRYQLPKEFQVINLKHFVMERFDFFINYYCEIYGTETFSRSKISKEENGEKRRLSFSSVKRHPILYLSIIYAASVRRYVEKAENDDFILPGEENFTYFTLIPADVNQGVVVFFGQGEEGESSALIKGDS